MDETTNANASICSGDAADDDTEDASLTAPQQLKKKKLNKRRRKAMKKRKLDELSDEHTSSEDGEATRFSGGPRKKPRPTKITSQGSTTGTMSAIDAPTYSFTVQPRTELNESSAGDVSGMKIHGSRLKYKPRHRQLKRNHRLSSVLLGDAYETENLQLRKDSTEESESVTDDVVNMKDIAGSSKPEDQFKAKKNIKDLRRKEIGAKTALKKNKMDHSPDSFRGTDDGKPEGEKVLSDNMFGASELHNTKAGEEVTGKEGSSSDGGKPRKEGKLTSSLHGSSNDENLQNDKKKIDDLYGALQEPAGAGERSTSEEYEYDSLFDEPEEAPKVTKKRSVGESQSNSLLEGSKEATLASGEPLVEKKAAW